MWSEGCPLSSTRNKQRQKMLDARHKSRQKIDARGNRMGVLGFKHWPSECLILDWMGMTIFWFWFFVVKYQPKCHLILIETWISWWGKKHTLIAKRENILKNSEKLVHRRTCTTCKSTLDRDLKILRCLLHSDSIIYPCLHQRKFIVPTTLKSKISPPAPHTRCKHKCKQLPSK